MNTLINSNLRYITVALAVTLCFYLAAASPVAAQEPCGATYTVVRGDTLNRIAARCNTNVSALVAANPTITNPNVIYPGQILAIPAPDAQPEPPDTTVYVVQPGDWLSRIARRFNTTVRAIVAANPDIANPDHIFIGQRIRIPEGATVSPQAAMVVSPVSGPPGAEVRAAISGFPPNTEVEIAVGRTAAEADLLRPVTTDANGSQNVLLALPESAAPGERWVFVARAGETRAVSSPFEVTAAEARAELLISPQSGPPGTRVRVAGSAFPANTTLGIGAGRLNTEYVILETVTTGAQGSFNTLVTLPDGADPGDPWIFVARSDTGLEVFSQNFLVTQP